MTITDQKPPAPMTPTPADGESPPDPPRQGPDATPFPPSSGGSASLPAFPKRPRPRELFQKPGPPVVESSPSAIPPAPSRPVPGEAESAPAEGARPGTQPPEYPPLPPPPGWRPRTPRRPRSLSPFGAMLVMAAGVLAGVLLFFALGQVIPDIEIPLPGSRQPLLTIKTPKPPSDMVLLVMGVDVAYANGRPQRDRFNGSRTDSMMLVRISPTKNTVSAVSLPRDSKVRIPHGHGTDKLNAAYAYGGASLAVAAVEEAFGIPVDRYLVVNTQGVRDLVDAIGGVSVVVEKPMHYRDRTARLNIQLEPGRHHLNGEQAEGFLRFRHDALGDIGRIRRQQQFVAAVAATLKNPWMVAKLPDLARFAGRYLDTNLSSHELLQLAWFSKDMDMSRVRVATLPGTPSNSRYASYWDINAVEAERVLDRLILDNPQAQHDAASGRPLSVGVVYDPAWAEAMEPLAQRLEGSLFQVVCRTRRPAQLSQIVERSRRVNDESSARLRRMDPALARAGLIFSPIGATFESTQCSMGEDYTLILGADALKVSR